MSMSSVSAHGSIGQPPKYSVKGLRALFGNHEVLHGVDIDIPAKAWSEEEGIDARELGERD